MSLEGIIHITDLPGMTLLPARVVADLRIIADYLVKAPGENQTGLKAFLLVLDSYISFS